MGAALVLGPVGFDGFEVPQHIRIGMRQRLAVHKLAGGGRVVDVLGPDDAPVTWNGAFSGSDAASRARILSLLCAAGQPLPLMWNGFFYTVVVSRFFASYFSKFWIPYQIECVVLWNLAEVAMNAGMTLLATELSDVAAAAGFGVDLSAAQAALAAPGATVRGTLPYAAAERALGDAQTQIASGLTTAGSQIGSADFPTALGASAQLANLSAARGYAARAAGNFARAST